MTLSSAPWGCAPVFASGWIATVPDQIFWAVTGGWLMAALRARPGVWAVLGSSVLPGITRTPSCFHFGSWGALMGLRFRSRERAQARGLWGAARWRARRRRAL